MYWPWLSGSGITGWVMRSFASLAQGSVVISATEVVSLLAVSQALARG